MMAVGAFFGAGAGFLGFGFACASPAAAAAGAVSSLRAAGFAASLPAACFGAAAASFAGGLVEAIAFFFFSGCGSACSERDAGGLVPVKTSTGWPRLTSLPPLPFGRKLDRNTP